MKDLLIEVVMNLGPAFLGLIGGLATAFISMRYKDRKRDKEVKELKAEHEKLLKLKESLKNGPLTLKNGIYFDEAGNAYCPACFGSPYDLTPLTPLNQQGSWTLYNCPKCDHEYPMGTRPVTKPKSWNPLDYH